MFASFMGFCSVCSSIHLFVCHFSLEMGMKIYYDKFKKLIFFSRTTKSISIKRGRKHPLVKGIQVCSREWPARFLGEKITT